MSHTKHQHVDIKETYNVNPRVIVHELILRNWSTRLQYNIIRILQCKLPLVSNTAFSSLLNL